jgi:hypothetical protein
MMDGTTGTWKVILSILFFPVFFQGAFLAFAWGAGDVVWLMVAKRLFLVLPVLGLILACWATMACLLTVLIRTRRADFIIALLVTWWDFGRAVFGFWGGTFKFLFVFIAALFALAKFIIVSVWTVIQDFFLFPFRMVRNVSQNVLSPGVPWIAVLLTVLWSLIEAALFTYVTTPLVIDTFSNMTGKELGETTIRVPLFLFMSFIVLGSYAVLSTWAEEMKTKNVAGIIRISVIELVTMFVEIVFLYREFVESLVPWFAQHASEGFELGIVGTLSIAAATWFGVRSISWFLFASHGTPTVMAIIRGSGVKPGNGEARRDKPSLLSTVTLVQQLKADMEVIQKKGEEVLAAFLIPPLQVVAAAVNFGTLLATGEHLFRLPFRHLDEVMDSRVVLHSVTTMHLKEGDASSKKAAS